MIHDAAVIGAGVVGAAIARELCRRGLTVAIVEAGADVGAGTSKANTAILHTGYDATPGTLEAKLVRRGHELMLREADALGIAIERTGALLIAWSDAELAALPAIADKAAGNGAGDVRVIDAAELRAREPHLAAGSRGALHVPGEAIIDPFTPPIVFAGEAVVNGARLHLRSPVLAIERGADSWTLRAGEEHVVRARWLVNAAGLHADAVDDLRGARRFTVTPRRGQLIVFDKAARTLLSHILLPIPTKHTKGVLVAPTVFGNVLLGPTAEDLRDRADTATTADGLAGLVDKGRAILPALLDEEITSTYAGLRAATGGDYELHVDAAARTVVCGGIRSTGLSASLAIAEHVANGIGIDRPRPRPWRTVRATPLGERSARPYTDAARIAADPAYGAIVCHCERVTRGELRDALRTAPIPACDLDGLRRRTRCLQGRCQGFHCLAEIAAMCAAATGRSAEDVLAVPRE